MSGEDGTGIREGPCIGKAIEAELGNRQGQRTDRLPSDAPTLPQR
jgi:hypothetical protein